jgi:hypothetical protein
VRFTRAHQPELESHALPHPPPTDHGRYRQRRILPRESNADDELGSEWEGLRSLNVHPAERDVLAAAGRGLVRILRHELHWAIERHALIATEILHGLMIASGSVDDLSRRRELHAAAWFALVPVGIAAVLGLLLAPRRAAPEGLPLPIADSRAIARAAIADHELADRARHDPLSGEVRALGSAIRAFHTLEAGQADAPTLGDARRAVSGALIEALGKGNDSLLMLRALQLEGFIDEVHRFEATGEQSAELQALGGAFVQRMKSEGWCDAHTLTPTTQVLLVMFKLMWNAFLGLSGSEWDPTLDEQRCLYAFYLSHPHSSKVARDAIASARRGARDARACQALLEAERAAVESWRLERIARLADIDPAYPADYARGIAAFGRGEYRTAATAFRKWLVQHPEGPLALRAQNYLRAVADVDRVE